MRSDIHAGFDVAYHAEFQIIQHAEFDIIHQAELHVIHNAKFHAIHIQLSQRDEQFFPLTISFPNRVDRDVSNDKASNPSAATFLARS